MLYPLLVRLPLGVPECSWSKSPQLVETPAAERGERAWPQLCEYVAMEKRIGDVKKIYDVEQVLGQELMTLEVSRK